MINKKYDEWHQWINKETFLIDYWYVDDIVSMITKDERGVETYGIEPEQFISGITHSEAEKWTRYFFEKSKDINQLSDNGIAADFIKLCWYRVNWYEIADAINEGLRKEFNLKSSKEEIV